VVYVAVPLVAPVSRDEAPVPTATADVTAVPLTALAVVAGATGTGTVSVWLASVVASEEKLAPEVAYEMMGIGTVSVWLASVITVEVKPEDGTYGPVHV
jgi:hypothetical protein